MSDVKPGRREMYAALTRTAVLDAAKALFVSKGFEATSVDDIARLAQSSKGAVYHHFRDKRDIFAEAFRASQLAIAGRVIDAITSEPDTPPWEKIQAAVRLCLRSYVADDDARSMLGQAVSVLGWERVRALDEETALPFLRTTLEDLVAKGHARPMPIAATVEIFFSVFCNAILYIAAAADPEAGCRDVEMVIFAALEGLKSPTSR